MVGCGEPFDGSRVPADLLEFYKEGGGRAGSRKVLKGMATKRKEPSKMLFRRFVHANARAARDGGTAGESARGNGESEERTQCRRLLS